jgi:filamentous hemagglutinin
MQPGLLPSEMAQLHAENRARDRSNTLAEWGVTALRSWIATVDASGVLNASTTTTTTAASGATGPGTTGNGLGGATNGAGSNSPGDWQQALQQAQAALNALASNTDPSGLTGANGNAAPGTPPPGNNPNPENPPAGAPPAGGNPPGNADQVRADVEQMMRDMIGRVESGGAGAGATQREVINCVTGETATLDAGLSASAIRWKTKTGPAPTLTEEQARNLAFGTNLAADAIPLLGTAKGVVELLTNRTLGGFGPEMSRTEWWLTLGATSLSVLPWGKVIGKATGNAAIGLANRAKSAYDALPALFQKSAKLTDDAAKAADDAIDRAIDASKASPDAAAVQNAIEELPNTGKLVFDPASRSWTSPGGLVYGQGSAHGNRVNHVLDHPVPNPGKPTHSLFNVDRTGLIGLIDEAFASRGAGVLQGNNRVFEIDVGRIIGTNGESRIRIVVREGTNNVITAYPVQ